MSRHVQAAGKAHSQRALRVGELVRHAVSEILARGDVHDPVIETHLITVPEVRMSPDLRLATVYVMPLGGTDEKDVLAALERNKRYLRGEVAHRVNLKFAPDIRFRVDERFEEAERIERLLRSPEVKRDLDRSHADSPPIDLDPDSRKAKCMIRELTPMPAQAEPAGTFEPAAAPSPAGPKAKRAKYDVHGWVVLDKPVGMTSTHAVSVIKRLFTAKRAGHAGTLDPLASGCLPIALGDATKTVPFVMDGRKAYSFTVRWGEERDTDDAEGRVVASSDRRPDPEAIAALLAGFVGAIQQVPPRYSAIKIEGERAYDIARDGEEFELEAREVNIDRLELEETPDPDHSRFYAECGKGTYVRALARDLGRLLGCYGHVSALRRTAVGPFAETDMISLERIEALCNRAAIGELSLADALLPVATALDDIPALAVSRADAARLQRGQAVLLRGRDAPMVRGTVYVTASGNLIALAEVDRGEIVPKRVFNLAGLQGRAGRQEGR